MRVLQVRSALQSLIYIVNYGLLALAYQPGSGRIVTITGSVALPIPMLQTIVVSNHLDTRNEFSRELMKPP